MEDKKKAAATRRRVANVEKSRAQFQALIAANPNYFGNFPGSKFKTVKKLLSNTSYEQLTELGYNPRMRRLTATFDVKKTVGYDGDLFADGTREYVRFYVNRGSGWEDAGLAAAEVHDIPAGKDCANRNTHPLSYSVDVAYAPRRKWCTSPQLPRARAILSWNAEPPAGQPNWKPVYGNVLECHIRIDKGLDFIVLADALKKVAELPPDLIKSIEVPLEKFPSLPNPSPVRIRRQSSSPSNCRSRTWPGRICGPEGRG